MGAAVSKAGAGTRVDTRLAVAARGLAGLNDVASLAYQASREAREFIDIDVVGVAVRDGDTSVQMLGCSGEVSEWFPALQLHVDLGQGFSGNILANGLALVADFRQMQRGIQVFDRADGRTSRTLLNASYAAHLKRRVSPEKLEDYVGVPLDDGTGVQGVIFAGSRARKPQPERTRALLATFASMISPAFARAKRDYSAPHHNHIEVPRSSPAEVARAAIERICRRAQRTLDRDEMSPEAAREILMIRDDARRALARLEMSSRVELRTAKDEGIEKLSAREQEVLQLLATGASTREICRELGLTTNTIRSYVQSVLEKLQANSRVKAVATARRLELI
jgi:DNA-binding CsgD family transcriptional regulator